MTTRARPYHHLGIALLAGIAVYLAASAWLRSRDAAATRRAQTIRDSTMAVAQAQADSAERARLGAELVRARERWAARGLHDYRFVLAASCFCAPPSPPRAWITVRADTVAVVADSLGRALPADSWGPYLPSPRVTVQDLLAEIGRQLEDSTAAVRATFDSALGYPRFINTGSRHVTDAGYSLSVEALRPL